MSTEQVWIKSLAVGELQELKFLVLVDFIEASKVEMQSTQIIQ